ncbi:hypothetical protein hamaS1_10190 [Moorella sp. Hama-1]|nr:hypothetical protein hamaS1_10190 [Moorella sp. Hama-1]
MEGERDADNLAALGLTATTNPGGAGKWRPEYGGPLRGAQVVILYPPLLQETGNTGNTTRGPYSPNGFAVPT